MYRATLRSSNFSIEKLNPDGLNLRKRGVVITLIGSVAAILTTVCWLPQVIKTTHTRRAEDFHWLYLAMLGIGVAGWFTYGVLKHEAPIYLANGVTVCFVATIAVVKARPRGRPSEVGLP